MKARSHEITINQNSSDTSDAFGVGGGGGGVGSSSSSSSAGGPHDLSILRKPIQTSITGFHEAIKAYEDGTDEIRKLLANECDIIYECKACRNIFRSLANFISHKRIYCKAKFNSAQHFHFHHDGGCIDQDISTIIQADHGGGQVGKDKNAVKDLGSIIERLARKEQTNRMIKLNDLYDQAKQNLTQDEIVERKHILQLDKLGTSKIAVFQTIKKEPNTDSIKEEINEVHNLLLNDKTVLGPDGKAAIIEDRKQLQLSNGTTTHISNTFTPQSSEYACEICHSKFLTEKTLKLHIKAKHIPSTYVYPCPSCIQTFLQPSAVIRHLNNDHKKSMRRIRLMRDAIFRRRTRIDEVKVKAPNQELARLQQDSKASEPPKNNWLDNLENIEATSICTFCAKTFERRAALITHTKNCSQKGKKAAAAATTSSVTPSDLNGGGDGSNNGTGDEDSASSIDHFLAMVNREKSIQASVQENIDEIKSKQLLAADEIKLETSVECSESNAEQLVKNKRKRNCTRKMFQLLDQLPPPPNMDMNDDLYWNMDDDGNLNILKPDPINGDCVISVTDNDIADSVVVEESSKATPAVLPTTTMRKPHSKSPPCDPNKTTDCTICEKKFANLSNLRRHVAMFHYRQKKFGCKLCDFKAYRKIDIINHLSSAHNMEGEKEVISEFVALIDIDKNKFNEEKLAAVTEALMKFNEKQLLLDPNFVPDSTVDSEANSFVQIDDIDVNATVKEEILDISDINVENNVDFQDDTLPNSDIIAIKRRRRSKIVKKVEATNQPHSDKWARTDSANSIESTSSGVVGSEDVAVRRPVRNRIKTVNKDFVYDLSNLLKKDSYKDQLNVMAATQPVTIKAAQKRKLSIQSSDEKIDAILASVTSTPLPSPEKRATLDDIRGAANVMAALAVKNNKACFNKPPEIPSERPIVPAKIIQLRRSESGVQDWKVLHKEKLQTKSKLPRRASNDMLDAVATKKRLSKKAKALRNGLSPTKSLSNGSSALNRNKIAPDCSTDHEFEDYLISNRVTKSTENDQLSLTMVTKSLSLSSRSSLSDLDFLATTSDSSLTTPTKLDTSPSSSISSSPSSAAKRITLMQRIIENKTKKLQTNFSKSNEFLSSQ